MPADDSQVHLIVRTGALRVALPMSALRSVVTAPPITRLPGSAMAVLGLAALAGELVPVVDLATLLDAGESKPDPDRLLVVVADGESQLAFRVDGVEGHAPVGPDGLFVLDIDGVLDDPRLSLFAPRSGAREELPL